LRTTRASTKADAVGVGAEANTKALGPRSCFAVQFSHQHEITQSVSEVRAMKRRQAAAVAALIIGAWVGNAHAHTHLKNSTPAAGATVAASLSEIRLYFDEEIEARLSKVTVVSVKGGAIATEAVSSDPASKGTLIVKLAKPLVAGSYKVNWQAISADTHKVKGSFSFHVRP